MTPVNRPNLLLISLDTLRADVALNGRLANFSALCTRGTVFESAVSSAPLTPVSHASVLTGMQPYRHGIRHLFKEQLAPGIPTLAQLLSAQGYDTGAIVSCPGLHRWYGLNQGFAHYDDEIPLLADGTDPLTVTDVKRRGTALKRAPLVVKRGLAWLDEHRHRPFFLFLHFFDTHWPYEPPEWFASKDANPYEGEAHYIDHYLGKLIQQVEEWGLLENTLLVLFSDHGEDLAGWYANDHSGEELGHPEEKGHGCLLYDTTQIVPLVFIWEGMIEAARRVTTQVRLVDLLPTITDLFEISDSVKRDGQTLRELFTQPCADRLAYCETYYREEQSSTQEGIPGLGPWKAIRIANHYKVVLDVNSGRILVFNMETDPHERHPYIFHESLPPPLL